MNVLSLFDGMSCGQIALNRAGINVKSYYASELDKYAITVTQANHPDTIQLGDVNNWRKWDIDWSSIDLLIGGSPCQGFSFAGKQLAFDDPRSKLFFVYVDILDHIESINPDVNFLLENVRMKKEYLDIISEHLDVEPVFINSALVSAQSRQRFYWANWNFEQPEDKGILLKDIIENDCTEANGNGWHDWWKTNREFQLKKKYSAIVNDGSTDKAITMTARQYAGWNGNFVIMKQLARGYNKGFNRLTDKTPPLTSSSWEHNHSVSVVSAKDKNPLIQGDYLHFDPAGKGNFSQCNRVNLPDSKHKSLSGTSGGKKHGVVTDSETFSYRKLTPIECERLQTVPDNYTNHVSNTQRYKMLGNGWTVDVIAHIFESMDIAVKARAAA
jgi:DNA-cytosine methyltransferase